MEIDVKKLLSEKMVETIEKHNFKVVAEASNNDLVIAGNVHFMISHNSLPQVPNYLVCDEVFEPYNVFQDADGNGPIVCITIFNRNMPNHDFSVLHSMGLDVERLDASTLAMNFLDELGHGVYGLPKNMKAVYEVAEKVVADARMLVKELSTFVN